MRARRLGSLAAAACLAATATGVAASGAGASSAPTVTPLIPSPAIAYTTSGSPDYVWLAGLHGTPARRLGRGETPLVSPTGTVAAARVGDKGSALTIYGQAKPLSLFDLRREFAVPFAFSADGRYLAVGLFTTSIHPRISDSRMVVVDTTTGKSQTVGYGYPCGASFAPTGDRLRIAFGLAGNTTGCESGGVDLFSETAGSPTVQKLTHDKSSTDPVWGAKGIVFTRLTYRKGTYPAAQLWLLPAGGGAARQETHTAIGRLVSGLYAQGVSADGLHVLATFGGQDTDEAWTLDLHTHALRRLTIGRNPVVPGSISQDGRTVLVASGDPFGPPRDQNVVTMPFGGGKPTVIVRHAGSPTWNR
jgi:hypothetical protein